MMPTAPEVFIDIPPDGTIFGRSSLMQELQAKLLRVAGTNIPVLLQGESGVGKGTICRFIHSHSNWSTGPYLKVNCTGVSASIIESYLPDVDRDEFGVFSSSASALEENSPSQGTLFLDGISELTPALQLKLLRGVPDGRYSRPQEMGDRPETLRVISATTRNLQRQVQENKFRKDLFYRLAVLTVDVPPLRHRRDDLLIIGNFLLRRYSHMFGVPLRPFSDRLGRQMLGHHWPGNIRELENFVCRYIVLGTEEPLARELVSHYEIGTDVVIDTDDVLLKDVTRRMLANVERRMIARALEASKGNRQKAAKTLGISYRTLLTKIAQAGLPHARLRTESAEG